jgi:hypothetical protein
MMKRTPGIRGSRIRTGYPQAGFDARRELEMGMFDSYPAFICKSLIRLHWNFTFGLSVLWISCSNRLEGGVAYKPCSTEMCQGTKSHHISIVRSDMQPSRSLGTDNLMVTDTLARCGIDRKQPVCLCANPPSISGTVGRLYSNVEPIANLMAVRNDVESTTKPMEKLSEGGFNKGSCGTLRLFRS